MLDTLLAPEMATERLIIFYVLLFTLVIGCAVSWRRSFKRTSNIRLMDATWTRPEYVHERTKNKRLVMSCTAIILSVAVILAPIFYEYNIVTIGLEAIRNVLRAVS